MEKVRCALVGLSWIASAPVTPTLSGGRSALPYSHASALAAIPEAELVAVCDLVPALTERFLEQWSSTWPNLHVYHDTNEMLANEKIDVLGICTPDHLHADILIQATASGIPAIMCEKPLATNLADADRMIAALEEHGTLCSVEHTRRWDPFFHRVRELIDAGIIGEVKTIVGTLHGERAMLFRNGTHVIDLMNYYAGSTPSRVFSLLEEGFDHFTAYRGDGGHDPSSEPGASAFIEYENGVRGFYNGTKGSPSHIEWDVTGTKGRIRINGATAELWTLDENLGELVMRQFPASMVMKGGLQNAYEELICALKHGGTVRSTPREARQTVAVLQAILDSHQAGNCLVEVQ